MTDIKAEYKVATGSITGTFYTVERWLIPVWPDNNGNLWFYGSNGEVVIIEDGDLERY